MEGEDLARYCGPPRSVIWRGGAVHLRCSGSGKVPDLHAHFAIQLSIGFAGDLSLRCGRSDLERSAPGWVIGSEQVHSMRGAGVGATIFWDPVSAAGGLVRSRLGADGSARLEPAECEAIRREFAGCWARGWLHADLRKASDRIARLVARPGSTATPLDRRVQLVLRTMQSDPAGKCSLAELAEVTKLSESRLAHLFRHDVGIPIRQYRLTLRMEEAAREIAAGASLTRAAYAAGFADPAHFCRICRRMFGGTPSELPAFEVES